MASSGSGGNAGSSHWVAIAIALITAIGVVIAAIVGGPQVVVVLRDQGQATGVALLQPTIESLRDQATPTNMPAITAVTAVTVITVPPPVTAVTVVAPANTPILIPNTPEPAPTTVINIFRDDFNGALSGNWQQIKPGLTTVGGSLIGTGVMVYEPETQNNHVRTRVKIKESNFTFGVLVKSSQSWGYSFSCGDQGCVWQEPNYVSVSPPKDITPVLRFNFKQDQYYDIRVDVNGDSCTSFINEESFSSIKCPDSEARTRVGLEGRNSGIEADFFEVTPIQ